MSDDIVQPMSVEVEEESASDALVPVDAVTAGSEPVPETANEAQEEEALVEPAPVEHTEDADVLESVPVSKGEDTVAPVAEPQIQEAQPRTVPPSVSGTGVIVEKEKPLTEEDKDAIFQNKLKDNLAGANARKQQKHEAHLQEIIDFIRKKGTLVSSQDIEEGLQILDTTVTRRLNELVHRGAVIRLGDQRHAKYKLTGTV